MNELNRAWKEADISQQGKKANTAKHERIKQLLDTRHMTKEEIAKAVGVGIATVYRVAKSA